MWKSLKHIFLQSGFSPHVSFHCLVHVMVCVYKHLHSSLLFTCSRTRTDSYILRSFFLCVWSALCRVLCSMFVGCNWFYYWKDQLEFFCWFRMVYAGYYWSSWWTSMAMFSQQPWWNVTICFSSWFVLCGSECRAQTQLLEAITCFPRQIKLGRAQGLTCVSKCVGIHLPIVISWIQNLCACMGLFVPVCVIQPQSYKHWDNWLVFKLFVSVGTHAWHRNKLSYVWDCERGWQTMHYSILHDFKGSTNIHFKMRPLWEHQMRDERQRQMQTWIVWKTRRENTGKNNRCLYFPSKYSHFVCSFLCICSLHLIRVQTLFTLSTRRFVVDKKHVMSKACLTLKDGGHCLRSHW